MQGITSPIKSRVYAQDSIPSFIRKTYDILEEAKFPDIIDWNPEGTALVIKKTTEFCQKVLPTYFKHSNLTSFVRQLNMYNFHKRRTQTTDHVYHHELFQRGKKYLLSSIKRKTHGNDQKTPKSPTSSVVSGQADDLNSVLYENQFLKQLYNDTMMKLNHLERQVQDLRGENESLLSQLSQSKIQNAQSKIQNAQSGYQVHSTEFYPPTSTTKENGFTVLNMDDSRASTELSYGSPSAQFSDKFQDYNEPVYGSKSFVSMNNMKYTPTFSAETQPFLGAEKCSNLPQESYRNPQSLLGKRQGEMMDPEFQAYEPLAKRFEASKGTFYNHESNADLNPLELSNSHFNWSFN